MQYRKLLHCFFPLAMYSPYTIQNINYNVFQEDRVENHSSLDVSAEMRASLDKGRQQDTTKVTDVTF
jgi:uncharacterized membrane protein YcgQ (UPF0703/DUF1980 family)